jgi:hypothetical protein
MRHPGHFSTNRTFMPVSSVIDGGTATGGGTTEQTARGRSGSTPSRARPAQCGADMTQPQWIDTSTWSGKSVADMTSIHILSAVQFIHRRAQEKRLLADSGVLTELEADRYLEWAQHWFKIFQAELARREHRSQNVFERYAARPMAGVSPADLLVDPGESDDE